MNKKNTPYIYTLIILFSFIRVHAQELELKLTSLNKAEIVVLEKINYIKTHKDTSSIKIEIDKISEHLKNQGYFTTRTDSVKKTNKGYLVFLKLNNKTKKASITINKEYLQYFNKSEIDNNTILVPIEKLQTTLLRVSSELDEKGESFSKVKLQNITIKNEILYAELKIHQSKKRNINKVIIKGYENFPTSFIKNYFNINSNSIFTKKKIITFSEMSKSLNFIQEIKPPEVLFTKDSTLLYLYLKKHQNNSLDGIISFSSKENGDLLFNGNLDLQLNNILNTGENFGLFWNSIGEEKQELKLSTEIPYIFSSKLSPEFSFSIYKQDSTFLNSKLDSKIGYHFNPKIKLALTYNSENSEDLIETLSNNVESYKNHFLGLQLKYTIPKNDFFLNNKFYFDVSSSFGKRKTDDTTSNQFKLETTTSYLWNLNLRNNIYIKNEIGYLNSDTYIYNELFRIGGSNSIRGFNEQSLFTNKYTYVNLEYRYLTSEKSYLYTITDIGRIMFNSEKENLLGLGLGYLFTSNNSQININISIGKSTSQITNNQNTNLFIKWINYF